MTANRSWIGAEDDDGDRERAGGHRFAKAQRVPGPRRVALRAHRPHRRLRHSGHRLRRPRHRAFVARRPRRADSGVLGRALGPHARRAGLRASGGPLRAQTGPHLLHLVLRRDVPAHLDRRLGAVADHPALHHRPGPGRRDAQRDRADHGVRPEADPRDHDHDHVLRLLAGRRAGRRRGRQPDQPFRLEVRVRARRHRALPRVPLPRRAPAGVDSLPGGAGRARRPRRRHPRRIDPAASIPAGATFTVEEHKAKGFVVRRLFANGRGPFTLLIWLVFFMSLLDLYFVTNWLPTIITDSGIAVSRAALITAMYQVGGILGTLLLGRLFDRFSPFVMLALTYLAASVFVLLIGTVGTSIGALVLTVFGAGFCVVGGQIGANALTANSYPTAIRSTGVGWALAIGRIGSIIGPIIGGLILSLRLPARQV